MRRLLLLALLAPLGCGKGENPVPSVIAASASTATDETSVRREADAQAAFSLDAAGASLEEAFGATKRLAASAGGDAKEALQDVAEMLDSAGATVSEHDDPPPTLDVYRKAEIEQTSLRKKALADALDALHELRDADGTLDDLAQNAPPEHHEALEAIQTSTEDAIASVEEAIKQLGGQVPPEDEGDAPQSSNDGS